MLDSAWLPPAKPGTAQESRFVSARSDSYKFFNLTVYKLSRADSPEESMISQSIPSSGNRDNCPGDTLDWPLLWYERWHAVHRAIKFSRRLSSGIRLRWCTVKVKAHRSDLVKPLGLPGRRHCWWHLAQRHPAFSLTDSAISDQLSGYLFGLGIAVKAYLFKIGRSLCYQSKFHPQLLAVKVNFNVALIFPQ